MAVPIPMAGVTGVSTVSGVAGVTCMATVTGMAAVGMAPGVIAVAPTYALERHDQQTGSSQD